MKLCHFSVAVEIAPRESWMELINFNVDNDGNLSIRYPYGNITPEQAAAVSKFVETITDAYTKLTKQIDATNKRLKLEQYAPIVPPIVKTTGSDLDLDANPAVSQSVRGGSEGIDNCPSSMEDAKEKTLAKTIEDNVIESLGLK